MPFAEGESSGLLYSASGANGWSFPLWPGPSSRKNSGSNGRTLRADGESVGSTCSSSATRSSSSARLGKMPASDFKPAGKNALPGGASSEASRSGAGRDRGSLDALLLRGRLPRRSLPVPPASRGLLRWPPSLLHRSLPPAWLIVKKVSRKSGTRRCSTRIHRANSTASSGWRKDTRTQRARPEATLEATTASPKAPGNIAVALSAAPAVPGSVALDSGMRVITQS
mmetsp:Transcript_28522/g.86108  ORF Transcript_28522/g.86108 Transcript_28522/m.86108 type:complete len:226 (-) Transcript_28522:561-1238(-)